MTSEYPLWIVLILTFCLDWLVGDPHWLPHPIRWMGRAITMLESRFRNLPMGAVPSGALFAGSLVLGTWFLTYMT